MKTSERHHLKEDDFQIALARTRDSLVEQRRPIAMIIGGVVLTIVLIGGYVYWQRSTNEKAAALFAEGIVAASTPIATPESEASNLPGQIAPRPRDAPSRPRRREPTRRSPSSRKRRRPIPHRVPASPPTIAPRHCSPSRDAPARRRRGSTTSSPATATASTAAWPSSVSPPSRSRPRNTNQAIAALQTLSQRADADVPVDAVLMQLGDAYQRAGRTPDAVKTFTRVVDEFPQSPYLPDARRRLDDLKATPGTGSTARS